MKFLLNMNIPRSLVGLLSGANYRVRHVGDIGLSTAFDTVIVIDVGGTASGTISTGGTSGTIGVGYGVGGGTTVTVGYTGELTSCN